MEQFAKCPECGEPLSYEEMTESYYYYTPGPICLEKWRGFCPQCNNQVYSWWERYVLTERFNMKKEFDDEI